MKQGYIHVVKCSCGREVWAVDENKSTCECGATVWVTVDERGVTPHVLHPVANVLPEYAGSYPYQEVD